MESKQQIEERRQKLREELINTKCTPEVYELAKATAKANEAFNKQLENCLKKGENYYRKITI